MREVEPTEEEMIQELSPEVQLLAQRELGETPQVMRDCLEQLRQLIDEEEPQFVCPKAKDFLVRFLRCRKYDVHAAMRTIRKYFKMRRDNPGLFDGLLPGKMNYKAVFGGDSLAGVLVDRDPQGRCICTIRLGAWRPDICPLDDLVRMVLLLTDYNLRDPQVQVTGVVTIADMRGLHAHHLRHYTPFFIRRTMHFVQECYPVRVKGLYIVNNLPIFELLYSLARPFLKTKIAQRIHFIGDAYEKLHALIPPELLPEEYGGTKGSYDFDLEEKIQLQSHFFAEVDQSGYVSN